MLGSIREGLRLAKKLRKVIAEMKAAKKANGEPLDFVPAVAELARLPEVNHRVQTLSREDREAFEGRGGRVALYCVAALLK